jgi:hypothetical protein
MINSSDKICKEYQNTNIIFNKFCSPVLDVYEIMWKNMTEPDRPQMKI